MYEELTGEQKGSAVLLSDGFLYVSDGNKRRRDGARYVKCRMKKSSCSARGVWMENTAQAAGWIALLSPHDHRAPEEEVMKLRLRNKLLLAAERSNEGLKEIFDRFVDFDHACTRDSGIPVLVD